MQTQLVRVGIVHNDGGSLFSRFIQAALSSYSPTSSSLISFLQGLLQLSDSPAVADVVNIAKESGLDGERLVQLLFGADINSTLAKHALFSSTVLRLKEGQNALLSNGKVWCGNLPIYYCLYCLCNPHSLLDLYQRVKSSL